MDPMTPLTLREARNEDWARIWPIVRDVAERGETFAYDPAMSEAEGREAWMKPAPARVTVLLDGERLLGTAVMYANRPGPGDHIASASFMVGDGARGKGVGRALVLDMIAWARAKGFAAIQFNAVVETNVEAIRLYESLGFVTLGTAPGAFRHARLGPVGLRIMWLQL